MKNEKRTSDEGPRPDWAWTVRAFHSHGPLGGSLQKRKSYEAVPFNLFSIMRKQLLTAFLLALTGVCAPSAWAVSGTEIPDAQRIVTEQNEYPITFYSDYEYWSAGNGLYAYTTEPLTAVVTTDKPALLRYYSNGNTTIKIDGVAVRELEHYTEGYFTEDLTAGTHEISWCPSIEYVRIDRVAVYAMNDITVSLLEPGSVGTEVLYNVDGLKQVSKLKVIGRMNEDDWEKIGMMTNLVKLDLSEAQCLNEAVPNNQFSGTIIKEVILPEGVKIIGNEAFRYSELEKINFPSSLTSIGNASFYESRVQTAELPEGVTSIGELAFGFGRYLKHITLPSALTVVPFGLCNACYSLEEIVLPEGLKEIGESAFSGCDKIESVVIPESVTSLGSWAFASNANLKHIVVPGKIYELISGQFSGCPKLETVRLNSPTVVVTPDGYGQPFAISDLSNAKLIVPDFQVNNYKLDKYWYNCAAFEGFDTSDVTEWWINNPLTLNHNRFGGVPTIHVNGGDEWRGMLYLKVNGTNPMPVNDLSFHQDNWYSYVGQFYSNSTNVTVNGHVSVERYTENNKWQFFTLPFDTKVSEITHSEAGVQHAVRYYDGATRAAGEAGNWKNFAEEDVIPAGTGFAIMTNKDTKTTFRSVDNATKQNVVKFADYTQTLTQHESEIAANRGWNLVGNPWQCYFNIHFIDYAAPIQVYNSSNNSYIAYSLADDDYALRPNEAFFVQSEGDATQITFPVGGRQLDDVVELQNPNMAAVRGANASRRLINLSISKGELTDRTRVVVNEAASTDYEIACDAAKLRNADTETPQLFTLDAEGQEYAINERPLVDGVVSLGYFSNKGGECVISMERCDVQSVYLYDAQTGEVSDLSISAYTFSAQPGVDTERFSLMLANSTTGIETVGVAAPDTRAEVYDLNGMAVRQNVAGLQIIRQNGETRKVFVK